MGDKQEGTLCCRSTTNRSDPVTTAILPPSQYPVRLASASGLSVQVNANGSIRRMDHRDIMLNLFLGTEMEGGPANLYLRRHGEAIETVLAEPSYGERARVLAAELAGEPPVDEAVPLLKRLGTG